MTDQLMRKGRSLLFWALAGLTLFAVMTLTSCASQSSFNKAVAEQAAIDRAVAAERERLENEHANAVSDKRVELELHKLSLEKERQKLRHELWLKTERARYEATIMTPEEVLKRKAECTSQIMEATPCIVPTLNDEMAEADVDQIHKILLAESVCVDTRDRRIAACYRQKGLHNNPAFVDPNTQGWRKE